MEKIENTLERAGLSAKQATLYIALLSLGEATSTQIAKAANLKRPTAYVILQEMLTYGFVSEILRGKTRLYSASHPKKITSFVRSRAEQMEEIYPDLLNLYRSSSKRPRVQVFEGIEAIRKVYADILSSLNRDQELLAFARVDAFESFEDSFTEYKKLLRKVKNPRIRELILNNAAGKKWEKDTRPFRGSNHSIRLISQEWEMALGDMLIYGDIVIFFSLNEHVTATTIQSSVVSQNMRILFELSWAASAKSR